MKSYSNGFPIIINTFQLLYSGFNNVYLVNLVSLCLLQLIISIIPGILYGYYVKHIFTRFCITDMELFCWGLGFILL